jgi:hypothetical protein
MPRKGSNENFVGSGRKKMLDSARSKKGLPGPHGFLGNFPAPSAVTLRQRCAAATPGHGLHSGRLHGLLDRLWINICNLLIHIKNWKPSTIRPAQIMMDLQRNGDNARRIRASCRRQSMQSGANAKARRDGRAGNSVLEGVKR